jgi:heme exporter protein CcmD
MSYVLAAYGATIASLVVYALRLATESRALREEIARARANGG